MRKAFVAIPTLSGKCLPGTEQALAFFELEAESVGWQFTRFMWAQDSLIAHARNVCVAKFLESDATDLFFLDSDVACGPGPFTRLMSHQVDFVCGVYRTKAEEVKFPVRGLSERKTQDLETGLLEVSDVPMGFARISRRCIEKLIAAYPDDWFYANTTERQKCYAFFHTEIRDRTFWGEDFYFCRRWREIGGKVWVDPEIVLAHVNSDGKSFAGSLAGWLRSQSKDQSNDQSNDQSVIPLKAAA